MSQNHDCIQHRSSPHLEEQPFSSKANQGLLQMEDESSSFGSSYKKSKNNRDYSIFEEGDEEQKSPLLLSDKHHPFEKTEKTLFELSNADRLLILSQLQEGRNTLSGLSRRIGIVVQEIHRNTNRLVEAGLVKKESGNSYSLTTLGYTTLMQLSSIKFLADNSNYFSEHSLGELPAKFIQRIGALVDSDFLDNQVAVVEYQKDLIKSTQDYLHVALPQVPSYLIEYVQPIIGGRRIKLHYVLPLNAIMPKKRHNESAHPEFHQLLQKGVIQRRMVKTIIAGVMMNEKQALLMFSSAKGKVEMSNCFCSKSEQFHEWCADYFEHIWKQSRPFDSKMLVEV